MDDCPPLSRLDTGMGPRSSRKILLLQDNFSGYIVPDNLQNIQVENFKPNLTTHVQPKDQGIVASKLTITPNLSNELLIAMMKAYPPPKSTT